MEGKCGSCGYRKPAVAEQAPTTIRCAGAAVCCNTDMPAILPLTPDPKVIDEALKSLEPVGVRIYSALGVL